MGFRVQPVAKPEGRLGQSAVEAHFSEQRELRSSLEREAQFATNQDGETDLTLAAAASATFFHTLGRMPTSFAPVGAITTAALSLRATAKDETSVTMTNDGAASVTFQLKVF